MTKDNLKLTTLSALILTVPALAWANLTPGDVMGTSEADIRAQMESLGYEVLEIEFEDDEIEVEYTFEGEGVEYRLTTPPGVEHLPLPSGARKDWSPRTVETP